MSHFNPYASSEAGGFDHRDANDSQSHASQSHGGSRPNYKRQFIAPVTIKMLNDATLHPNPESNEAENQDNNYFSHGVELSYVRFIGVIREIDDSSTTQTVYKLEDGTGNIQVRAWNNDPSSSNGDDFGDDVFDDDINNNNNNDNNNNDDDEPTEASGFKPPKFQPNQYIEVVASVREFNNKVQIQVQKLSKIKDFNQVPYHLLNVAKHYLECKNKTSSPNSQNNTSTKPADSLFVSEDSKPNQANGTNATSSTKNLHDSLYDFIRANAQAMADGVPLKFILHEFDLPSDDIVNAIHEMVDDGRIFSTNEDDSFLVL